MNGVVVPLKINAGLQVSLPVLGDFVVFCEVLIEVQGVSFVNVFNSEVIN